MKCSVHNNVLNLNISCNFKIFKSKNNIDIHVCSLLLTLYVILTTYRHDIKDMVKLMSNLKEFFTCIFQSKFSPINTHKNFLCMYTLCYCVIINNDSLNNIILFLRLLFRDNLMIENHSRKFKCLKYV